VTRTLVWKELREQWVVWVFLALSAAAFGAGLYTFMSPTISRAGFMVGILGFVAWGYGLVAGALPFAGEAEEGTEAFLDVLPGGRGRVWRVKAATGLALVLAQMAALVAIGYAFVRHEYRTTQLSADLTGLAFLACVGYAWGLCGGSFRPSVLSAIGWGILLQAAAWAFAAVTGVVLVEAFVRILSYANFGTVQFTVVALVSAVAAARGRAVYCRPDRLRAARSRPRAKVTVQRGWGVLLWLSWRQLRWFALGMVAFALLGTAAVAYLRAMGWPVVTTLSGIACGVAAFADEQQSGAFRFAGDQRFPLRRLWVAKAGVCFAIGAAAMALLTFGVAVTFVAQAALLESRVDNLFDIGNGLASGLTTNFVWALTVWPLYGFAVGLLCGLLIRRPLAAAVAAVVVAYPLAFLWLPSLFVGGGLHNWQLWGVPPILLVGSLALIRPRAAGCIPSPRATWVVLGTALGVMLFLAAALGYRAVEFPANSRTADVDAFEASMPTPEENAGGRLAVTALNRLADVQRNLDQAQANARLAVLPADQAQAPEESFFTCLARANDVAARGWQPEDRRLGAFLDRMFADRWARDLAAAAELPPGIVVDPRDITPSSPIQGAQFAGPASTLLVARGLQMQARGDDAAFVDNLRTALALARNMRHRTVAISVLIGEGVRARAVGGVERWLERLDGRPDLLRRALDALLEQQADAGADPDDVRLANALVARNALADPEKLPRNGARFNDFFFGRLEDIDLLRLAWQAPWEKERLRRLRDAGIFGDAILSRMARDSASPLVAGSIIPFSPEFFPNRRKLSDAADARAALLEVALRLYRAEKGKAAEQLDDLVPEYLPSVPLDPFDGQPFRYRLSRGEVVKWPPPGPGATPAASALGQPPPPVSRDPWPDGRRVPAGQGILWSVGEDRVDDGGHDQLDRQSPGTRRGVDLIYLVPLPAARP
jgi:hypothetical protein